MEPTEILTKAKDAALAGLREVARAYLSEYDALTEGEKSSTTEAMADFVRDLLPDCRRGQQRA